MGGYTSQVFFLGGGGVDVLKLAFTIDCIASAFGLAVRRSVDT